MYCPYRHLSYCVSRNYVAPQESDYTHYAFSIAAEDFEPFSYKLKQSGVTFWKDNKSEGQSFYFVDPDGHKLAACGRFSIPTDAVPGEALLWNAFRTWKIITQLCDLPPSIQFYVPFWGQIPKIKSNNPLIFNKLNEKASPAFAPTRQEIIRWHFLCEFQYRFNHAV